MREMPVPPPKKQKAPPVEAEVVEPASPAETAVSAPTPRAPNGKELSLYRAAAVTELENTKPQSRDEAKELLARAVAEIALQGPSLRRLRQLMRTDDDKGARETWREVFTFLKEVKNDTGSSKPVQIQLNNFIPRPG